MPSKGHLETASSSLSSDPQELTPVNALFLLQLLRLPAVMARTGLSKTAVYTTPGFPKPVKLTRQASAWVSSEIDVWIQERMAARG